MGLRAGCLPRWRMAWYAHGWQGIHCEETWLLSYAALTGVRLMRKGYSPSIIRGRSIRTRNFTG